MGSFQPLQQPQTVSVLSKATGFLLNRNCTALRLRPLRAVHAALLLSEYTLVQSHTVLLTTTQLVSQYAQLGSVHDAHAVFSAAPNPGVFLWNVIIRCWADNGMYRKAISLYNQMHDLSNSVIPDKFTFPIVLKACGHLQDLEEGKNIHLHLVELGYHRDMFVANSLIFMYGRCASIKRSRQVFDEMRHRNVVTWSTMVGIFAQNGLCGEALCLFQEMLWEGVLPNRVTFLNVMPCVLQSKHADQVYGLIIANGLNSDLRIQNSAVGMFAACGKIQTGRRLFNKIADKDLISWSSMIEAYTKANFPMDALELFKKMNKKNINPDHVTLLGVISACSAVLSLELARFIHGFVVKSRFGFDHMMVLETALVDLYVKCASLKLARRVFDQMPNRNLISWSTMISGYGVHGKGKDAIKLFNEMKRSHSDIKPDSIIFIALLSACSHSGLIDDGWRCFNSMKKEFGVVPRSEHYACMVDLMGRAGQLNTALKFIKDMPIVADADVWGSLLGACRIHLNVEMAEIAAKSLLELDPKNSGRYILLSNIYTYSGKRNEADGVRALMKKRGIKKTAGQSIIQVRNKIYKFGVGDRSNPQTDRIYAELEILLVKMKKEGYVPNTNFVLLDVDDEAKESLLYVHSEKLAIVFGLLNLGPESEIRIHKNQRFCGDCHSATKFISKITSRKIVVRDSRRFHHFEDGQCSCGDYW
ncbi:Pentatricopeptide repeat-containing protein [Zostera marina]|uniref:Pentatricopeptide repeat-containing protein n=1 Tax=Zostera marina TaxID=29655 RepID=A0A0K9PZE5_ZOSMR|nr:Pentatricopeptide repeat-containing protein [Zostera marina]